MIMISIIIIAVLQTIWKMFLNVYKVLRALSACWIKFNVSSFHFLTLLFPTSLPPLLPTANLLFHAKKNKSITVYKYVCVCVCVCVCVYIYIYKLFKKGNLLFTEHVTIFSPRPPPQKQVLWSIPILKLLSWPPLSSQERSLKLHIKRWSKE